MTIKSMLTVIAIALSSQAAAIAASMEGQTFEEKVQMPQGSLVLNGLGLRGVLFIKGYVAGLYLPKPARTFDAIADMPGAKRLQLRMLRDATPQDFIKAMTGGMQNNLSTQEYAALEAKVRAMAQIIEGFGISKSGDIINFDFSPEQGTSLSVNGITKGSPIPGGDFYIGVLKVFIGDYPVDSRLKSGLLGP